MGIWTSTSTTSSATRCEATDCFATTVRASLSIARQRQVWTASFIPRGRLSGRHGRRRFQQRRLADLYIGVTAFPTLGDATNLPNRLFLSDGQGGFVDATTSEIADEGLAFDLAVGDIDNDGDLDIFQTATADDIEAGSRNLMFLNLGDGQFLDVTEGVGLGVSILGSSAIGAVFADVDNDADLDLVIGISQTRSGPENFLLLNDGSGIFTDATNQSGIDEIGGDLAFGDFDEDGFVDLFYPSLTRLGRASFYRNNGNNNHWLRVELIGIESNRNGIGARLFATPAT